MVTTETTLMGSRICQVGEDVSDDAIKLALLHYGQTVVERDEHMFPPYLQVIEEEDGNYLWWLCDSMELGDPEASIFKTDVLRSYIAQVEGVAFA